MTDFKDLIKLYKQRKHDAMLANYRKKKRADSVQSMDFLLHQFFKKTPESFQRYQQSRAMLGWSEVVGEAVARASKPIKFRDRQMIVHVKDPIWMQQLLLLKREILLKYRRQFPDVALADIFFTTRGDFALHDEKPSETWGK